MADTKAAVPVETQDLKVLVEAVGTLREKLEGQEEQFDLLVEALRDTPKERPLAEDDLDSIVRGVEEQVRPLQEQMTTLQVLGAHAWTTRRWLTYGLWGASVVLVGILGWSVGCWHGSAVRTESQLMQAVDAVLVTQGSKCPVEVRQQIDRVYQRYGLKVPSAGRR